MTKQMNLSIGDSTGDAAADYSAAVGCKCSHRGQEGTILAYDADSYVAPMLIVRFDSGRLGVLRPCELGAS
jgi:hypothetical protein